MDTSRLYTQEELRNALDSIRPSFQPPGQAHGLNHPNNNNHNNKDDEPHLQTGQSDLSMLQQVTATVILDYQAYLTSGNAPTLDDMLLQRTNRTNRNILNLDQIIRQRQPIMALAAEFKRASPSKGQIVDATVSAAQQAVRYATAGADIISVLTERRWFQGSLQDLQDIRNAVGNDIVVLRKDFVVSEYMIAEAYAAGADTVLLIVAVLPTVLLSRLIQYCRSLNMEPLVEVHNVEYELPVALAAGAKVIGVNNRNLHTFQMDMTATERVAERLKQYHHPKDDITLCALSGMSTAADVDRYRRNANCQMVLIGESLMRSTDPQRAIQSLCLDPVQYQQQQQQNSGMSGGGAYTGGTQLIKVCGITNPDDAMVACQAGANLIGMIFVPHSPRCVPSPDMARTIADTVRAFGERTTSLLWTNTKQQQQQQLRSEIISAVQKRPAVVGVFQNQSDDYIRRMVKECHLDMVQLHGQEGMKAAHFDNYGVPVIRVVDIAVRITPAQDGSERKKQSSVVAAQTILDQVTDDPALILLDTAVPGSAGGGTGMAFDWSIADELQNAGLPVIVAGGLHAESVATCIQQIRPFGVDVSSGVEASDTKKGIKDHDKVRAFLRNAKMAAIEASKGF
jgi:anthranilate synthase / indole-3-glycerol phosphate synthase / phosphoribosylanthranilate isomerase